MKTNLKKYLALHDSLMKEKNALEARLAEINSVLGTPSASASPKAATRRGGGRRARNELSLKEAVARVTSGKGLTKAEILEAIQKLGYKFATKDPMNSLNTVLYTGKAFKNVDGKFSAAK